MLKVAYSQEKGRGKDRRDGAKERGEREGRGNEDRRERERGSLSADGG